MSGILRLANTGAGTGRSTLQSNASNDVTFNLPDTGSDSTATILTSDLHSITSVNWDGMTINITNADFNVDSGTLFVDESTNRVGIGTTSPAAKLEVNGNFRVVGGGGDTGTGLIAYTETSGEFKSVLAAYRLAFFTGQNNARTESVRIDNLGNVGIGVNNPDQVLHLRRASGNVYSRYTNDTVNGYVGVSNSQSTFDVYVSTNHDMRFLTNNGEKMRIEAGGIVGIGTTSPNNWPGKLAVIGDGIVTDNDFISRVANSRPINERGFRQVTDGVEKLSIYSENTSDVPVNVNGAEALRIDGSRRLLVGTNTGYPVGTSLVPKLLVQGSIPAALVATRDDSIGAILSLAKGKSTANIDTPVVSGDNLGEIRFAGYDGSDFVSNGASIKCDVDSTPGANNMPGRLVFSTTADGASFPTERMRIRSDGGIGVGGSGTGNAKLSVSGTSAVQDYYTGSQVSGIIGGPRVSYRGFGTFLSTNADLTVLEHLNHFEAALGTSVSEMGNVTNQRGFFAAGNLIGATNNYGFYSDIASGSNRWNFFANGTARNYFAGNVNIGATTDIIPNTTTTEGFTFRTTIPYLSMCRQGNPVLILQRTGTNGEIQQFYRQNTQVGDISVTGSSTSYNTSSDYRLKENVTTMVGAADRVKALKPCRFNFIADPSVTVDGFLAHEAQEVVPEAVTGEKDGEKMQAIDTSKLVPLLTAALQEALTEISELKERVKNLEG